VVRTRATCSLKKKKNSFEDALETADIDLWADELLEEGMREGLSNLTTPEELDNRSWIYEELHVES
jgi:hypothetical protein